MGGELSVRRGGRSCLLRVATAGLSLTAGLLASCGEGGGGTSRGRPSTVVVVGPVEVTSVDPLVSSDQMARQLEKYVLFTPLVRMDDQLNPRPYLARSWEFSQDSSSVTFHLRSDVRWQDGQPTTARDVAFTFRAIKDSAVGFPSPQYFAAWDSARVLDDHTIRFFVHPTGTLLFGWSEIGVLPEHVLENVPPAELANHPFGSSSPIGNGPFRFEAHRPGQQWEFSANPDFPEALGGPPRIDRLVYRVVPEPATRLAELRNGSADLDLAVPADQLDDLASSPGLRTVSYTIPGYVFVAWNEQRPFFRNAAVRRALTMGIDRRKLVQVVEGGRGRVAFGPVGPWHWSFSRDWKGLPYAPDSARRLLSAEGWVDHDGDGVRDRDGVAFRFDLLTNENPARRDAATMIQSDLAGIGVEAEPRVREMRSIISAIGRPERDFDAIVFSYTTDRVFDDRDLWSCGSLGGPYHITGYCDPSLDAVLDSLATVSDRETLRGLFARYERIIQRDQPYTFLYNETRTAALRDRLQGVRFGPAGEWQSVSEWQLKPVPGRVAP